MLTKFRTLASLYRQAGFRWSAFRLAYTFRLRTGLIRLQMPQYKWEDRPLETWLKKDIPSTPESYAQWRKNNSPKFFFDKAIYPNNITWDKQTVIDEAEKILSGEIKYFAHQFHKIGFPPHWHSAPGGLSKITNIHWSQISDDNHVAARRSWFSLAPPARAGVPKQSPHNRGLLRREEQEPSSQRHTDIKFTWEPNRFSFVYTLVRAYAASQDEKYAEAFWISILDWSEHNHPNTGSNWMDGQEISLRLIAWTFGFYAFLSSPSTTPERVAQFTTFVAAQAQRIYQNIDYAISTQSNHTISEACGLWLVGILFPELNDSEKYLSLGRKLLEEEAVKQIFPDGSYSMYSLNYHRFILQIYFYAMRLGELNNSPLSESVKRVVTKSIDHLYQLIDPQTGQMPVYGSNDGALVLSLNNCDFTDYRPLLQLGSYMTKGKKIFESGVWDEDLYWLYGSQSLNIEVDIPKQTNQSFSNGGAYILRNTNSKAVIRCTDYQSRPSHADQLHVDLWIQGHNIACDAGTYLYSGEGVWRNGLAHTNVHNTVTVDNKDQMTMVSRFTWTDWSKGRVLQNNEKLWQGEHDSYKPIAHKRTVLALEGDRWVVIDNLLAKESHHYALHWLLSDYEYGMQELAPANGLWLKPPTTDSKLSDSKILIHMGLVNGNGNFSIVRADPDSTRGWRSRYYGHKEPAISVMLKANQPQVTFWTFFGYEDDRLEFELQSLKINSTTIDLNLL
ncbi:MAG: alginate lyase family protein [Anaerolineales bacterium]|nr:alginate lyase family protein [Anaerolineales bacterium]